MSTRPPHDLIAFAERLMSLLDQGQFVATYKYAVLLGLMDLCLEATDRHGQAPQSVTTRELARKVIELASMTPSLKAYDALLESEVAHVG